MEVFPKFGNRPNVSAALSDINKAGQIKPIVIYKQSLSTNSTSK